MQKNATVMSLETTSIPLTESNTGESFITFVEHLLVHEFPSVCIDLVLDHAF